MRVRASVAAFLLLSLPGLVSAQSFRGGIQGVVLDQTGASVPGASVSAKSSDTGLARTTTSDAAGNYAFPELPLGDYDVTGSLSGFASQTVKGVRVDASSVHRVNLTLSAGLSESVEVTADVPLVNTTTNTQGATLQGDQVSELPVTS